ncbi:MAG TPA: hypothetical protein PLC59_08010 [Bacteroidales bacterium]|jgi:hypothetical protein|nr:hypothetical protein [Bacteroidales bacterium]HQI45986.1 hypothetical protein [Bacteroidales bacterium]
MNRKVTIEVKYRITLTAEEGVEISELMDDLEPNFQIASGQATIDDEEVIDYEVTDSR